MVKGMKARTSSTARLRAWTSRGFSVLPAETRRVRPLGVHGFETLETLGTAIASDESCSV
eukprot:scaffold213978_cov42-Prasinocladus_malaysianus.AAC.2